MVLSNKEWLAKMDEIISAIQNGGGDSQVIEDMLSNMWISSATYNVGDYVLYNNNIWRCLIQNSNIAPTEGNTWTRVTITNEISTLNRNLKPIDSVPTSGYTLNDDGSFLDRDIQHIKCRISHPIVKTSAYLNIGTLPHQVKKTCYTTAILLNGSNVYPLIIKLQGTTISMFNSIAIQALDNGTQVESWIDCDYLISG